MFESVKLKRAEESFRYQIQAKNNELDELRLLHRREMQAKNEEIVRLQSIEETLEKKFREEKALAYKTLELEFKSKQMEEVNKIRTEYEEKHRRAMEENFAQLKDQLAKLHSEGNAQTKFTEEIALKMMDQFGKVSVPRIESK